jgi:phenylalanyl-tRNA synthetase alpha subunit
MNDNSDESVPVQDAEIVEPVENEPVTSQDATSNSQDATMILELETMIKNSMATTDRNKDELKKLKEMLESALGNDDTYKEASEKAKEAAKVKGKAKLNVLANPATRSINEKIKDLTQDIKELNTGLSEYLREYQRLSGASEIEGEDGDVREIIYIAKLIKKSRRQ